MAAAISSASGATFSASFRTGTTTDTAGPARSAMSLVSGIQSRSRRENAGKGGRDPAQGRSRQRVHGSVGRGRKPQTPRGKVIADNEGAKSAYAGPGDDVAWIM